VGTGYQLPDHLAGLWCDTEVLPPPWPRTIHLQEPLPSFQASAPGQLRSWHKANLPILPANVGYEG
jgi:hypothetical protein